MYYDTRLVLNDPSLVLKYPKVILWTNFEKASSELDIEGKYKYCVYDFDGHDLVILADELLDPTGSSLLFPKKRSLPIYIPLGYVVELAFVQRYTEEKNKKVAEGKLTGPHSVHGYKIVKVQATRNARVGDDEVFTPTSVAEAEVETEMSGLIDVELQPVTWGTNATLCAKCGAAVLK